MAADGLQRARVSGPDRAVARGEHRSDLIRAQSFERGVADHPGVAKAIDALARRHPHVAFPIFVEPRHGVAGETVSSRESIHPPGGKTIEATSFRADPHGLLAI